MAIFKKTMIGGVGLATGLMLGVAGVALSQGSPAPPSWSTLVRCAQNPSDDSRLACYDDAMRTAGYAPRPEAVAAEHRKFFGLSIPKIGALKRESGSENPQTAEAAPSAPGAALPPAAPVDKDRVTVVIDKVAVQGDGRMLFITDEGSVWVQTDDTQFEPFPVSGQTMEIKRGKLGGYLCQASKYKAIRCVRSR